MRLTMGRGEFAAAVSWAAQSLPARPAAAALGGLRISADDAGLRVSGFDYETATSGSAVVRVETPGGVLVPGRLLAEIAHSLPDHPVGLSVEGGRLEIACGPYRYALRSLSPEDYPDPPAPPEISGLVSAERFAAAAAQVAVAAGRDESLPFLTGIRIEADGATLRLVATDRYRLAARELSWQPVFEDLRTSALVPARTLAALAGSLGSAGQVALGLPREAKPGAGLVALRTPERSATARVLDGEFAEYERVFPDEYAGHVVVHTASFVDAVRRTALVGRTAPVRLTVAEGRLGVEAGSDQDDQAGVAIEALVSGPDIAFAPNPGHLVDGLTALGSEYARLDYTAPAQPAVLTGLAGPEDEPDWAFRYLFLPVRSTV